MSLETETEEQQMMRIGRETLDKMARNFQDSDGYSQRWNIDRDAEFFIRTYTMTCLTDPKNQVVLADHYQDQKDKLHEASRKNLKLGGYN